MTIQLTTLFFILLVHYLADFGLQTHNQATTKYLGGTGLFGHIAVYSLVWLLAIWVYTGQVKESLIFTLITFIAHGITDVVTANIGKPFWEKKDFHNGFVVVGADQLLHYLQLIILYTQLF